jgi:hypothetical protein
MAGFMVKPVIGWDRERLAIPGISDQESVIRSPWTFFRADY